MTTKDAIKHLSDKIDYAEQCDDKWVDSVSIKALYIAVRAMTEERKKGKWIVEGHHPNYLLRCSACQEIAMWAGGISYIYPNFCPKCGAEMENADERFNQ